MVIINLGSVNIDHVYQVPDFVKPGETLSSTGYQQVLGGKGANQSIALAHAGGTVKHIGKINASNADLMAQLTGAGVDCCYVLESEQPTGHAIIQVANSGENSIVLFAGANRDVCRDQIQQAIQDLSPGNWVLTQNETNGIAELMQLAKQQRLKVAFNPAPMNEQVLSLPLDLVDLFIVNEVEAADLAGSTDLPAIEAYFKANFSHAEVIITLGKSGVIMLRENERIEVPAFNVEAVDTTAAGDTFIGFFLANYTDSNNAQTALVSACAASAIAVTRHGAAPAIPTADEVNSFLAQHSKRIP